MKHTNYLVINAIHLTDLVEETNRLLNDGWQCQGGISTDGEGRLVQAMVFCPEPKVHVRSMADYETPENGA